MFKFASLNSLVELFRFRHTLFSTTKFEFKQRSAGSGLGLIWAVLYPILFLSVYLFIYLAVFKLNYPELNQIESIIYIFSKSCNSNNRYR